MAVVPVSQMLADLRVWRERAHAWAAHDAQVRQVRRGWLASCSCGWTARDSYVSKRECTAQAIHHVWKAWKEIVGNSSTNGGVSSPELSVPSDRVSATR